MRIIDNFCEPTTSNYLRNIPYNKYNQKHERIKRFKTNKYSKHSDETKNTDRLIQRNLSIRTKRYLNSNFFFHGKK